MQDERFINTSNEIQFAAPLNITTWIRCWTNRFNGTAWPVWIDLFECPLIRLRELFSHVSRALGVMGAVAQLHKRWEPWLSCTSDGSRGSAAQAMGAAAQLHKWWELWLSCTSGGSCGSAAQAMGAAAQLHKWWELWLSCTSNGAAAQLHKWWEPRYRAVVWCTCPSVYTITSDAGQ